MNFETLKYQMALTQIKGIGNIIAKTLLAHTGSAEAIFKQHKQQLIRIPSIGEYIATQLTTNLSDVFRRVDREIDFILKNKITPLFFTDETYPFRLKECVDAPMILYSKGNQDYNAGFCIAIVGTRKITEYGKNICHEFVKDLSQLNHHVTIVSGLAYGVDICAHKASLECGLNTVGVLGHGLDRIYPGTHRAVAIKMLNQGALLTEYMSETNPDAPNFVQRNRIVAGMIDALVVIESATKGGALITAEIASSYNRDVFAFPGNIKNEYSGGCNKLIKTNKAALIECAADLEKMMGWERQSTNKNFIEPLLFPELLDIEKQMIHFMRLSDTVHINQILSKFDMPMSKICPLLIEMEFKGLVKCFPGNLYKVL